ncbi:MAG TPA: FkbM family methyltransferase [Oligoflexia bacterium]|nr:FkbM family methyltransferase [Oligoflexia bacterium]HMP47236.1 FkbM family methyltransferase [Oligoflexia bacterium]
MIKTVLTENSDGKFIVIENDTLGQHLLRGELWEPHFKKIAETILCPGDTAIDVGANIGYNSVIMGKLTGDLGRVYAFEPLRITFQELCGNIIINGLDNVFTENVAIGHVDNVTISMVAVDYNEKDINIMNSCVGSGGDIVKMRTLDSYAFDKVKFLKVDVQGCELAVLKGSRETLSRCRPVVFIEIEEDQLKNQNTSSEAVMFELMSQGYDLLWNDQLSLFDWVGVPIENPEILELVKASMGESCQLFRHP